MFGFNKKDARVIWRHEYFNRIVVLEIDESRTAYAVANIDSVVNSLRGEFHDGCVHAIDHLGKLCFCEVLARSFSLKAMKLIAENIDACYDTTRIGYRD
ncbi:hypothetical protein [Rheinheimera aquimaris]|jgi:hypothetical protein|uniref:hypothetical protein n=1 Tax=Rheinheimera aquimaris TaxID=412437 RepID=UPI001066FBE9|nr:hypothetical protein [Rheinheimera aquimaris]